MATITGKILDLPVLIRLIRLALPYKKIMFFSLSVIVLIAFVSPVRPWLIQHALDYAVLIPDKKILLSLTLIIFSVIVVETALLFAEEYYTGLLGQLVVRDLRIKLFSHLTRFRIKFFDTTPVGTLVTRTVSDIEIIADVFTDGFLIIAGDMLQILMIVSWMFFMNWELTLISLSSIPLLLIATYIFKNAIKSAFQDVRNQVARLNTFVQEHITGMSIVQIFNRENAEFGKFKTINEAHTRANIRSVFHYSVFLPVVEILSAFSIGMVVWWGTKGVLEEKFTLGSIISFILYIYMLFRPIRQLADRFNTLQMGMVSSERVFRLLDTYDGFADTGTRNAQKARGGVEFKNIWFAYNDSSGLPVPGSGLNTLRQSTESDFIGQHTTHNTQPDWILRDVSFEVKQGETLAIVGATGAGKSTIINLLSRFYEYQKGEILLDGVSIRDYDLQSFRRTMAVVSQNVFLFSDSIINNITLKDPAIKREDVEKAAAAIELDEFINRLPGKYNYNVRERGTMLSSGQRQLIAFIRASVFNPKILILDEATSSVDTETEQLLQRALTGLIKNRTSIIIAHRLATIQHADKILVLDKGKIAEQGTHRELLQQKGLYKKLYDLQFEFV